MKTYPQLTGDDIACEVQSGKKTMAELLAVDRSVPSALVYAAVSEALALGLVVEFDDRYAFVRRAAEGDDLVLRVFAALTQFGPQSEKEIQRVVGVLAPALKATLERLLEGKLITGEIELRDESPVLIFRMPA